MEVNIESIGSEDGYYDKEDKVIKVFSLEQSASEINLRLKLASGVNVNTITDDIPSGIVISLSEAFKQIIVIEPQEAVPEQHWYPDSGKKVAQWKKETYGRLRK
jgi:hypothetical protein